MSNDQVLQNVGIYTGTTDIMVAVMTGTDAVGSVPTYETPILLAESVDVSVTPSYREGAKYASNVAVRRSKFIDKYDIKFTVPRILASVKAKVLGRKYDENGVQIVGGDNQAPYVAVGFGFTKDNGAKELWWMLKGKFSEIEASGSTETDSLEYKDMTLSGTFDRRVCDNNVATVADSDDPSIAESVITGWFNAVYQPTGTKA